MFKLFLISIFTAVLLNAGWFDRDMYTNGISDSSQINKLINQAINEDKYMIIEATSAYCPYSSRMNNNVFSHEDIRASLKKDFVFIKVEIGSSDLPFGLNKYYEDVTPSFFVVSPQKQYEDHVSGSMTKDEFIGFMEMYSE